MRFSKVLLISPPSSSYLGAARPPQNLGYLAESLLQNNISYDVMDMRLGHRFKHLQKKLTSFKPDLVGVSLVSLEYKRSYELIDFIKSTLPTVKIVVGGPHLTVLQEQVLQECKTIDFGVIYEGEETLVELCQSKLDIDDIQGLIYHKENSIKKNSPRQFKENLDNIPFPTYQHFQLNQYIREIPLNSSRGCPFQCVFCPNKMITKKFRWRSAENVVDEIDHWYQNGFRVFNFDDDNFGYFQDRVYAICDEIEKRNFVDAEFRCSNGLRADRVNRDILKRMKEVGFHYIAYGVDGGNNKMLKANKKGETIEQIESAIQHSCDLGFDVKLFCILGMPSETIDDVNDSFAVMQKYPVKRIILNNPVPYPGTELFDIVKRNGWFVIQPEEYLNTTTEDVTEPVFATPELSREQRIEILKKSRKIERQVTIRAVYRMYQKFGILGYVMAWIFSLPFFEKLFFKNKIFRQLIEMIRHRRMLKSQK